MRRSIFSITFLPSVLLVSVALWSCVNPQQVELLEREQRRLRGDMTTLRSDVDNVRSTLADTRANIQQMQRDLSAIKERIDETRVQVGRQIGQTNRDGDQRVKDMETRLAKLEEDAKSQAELLKSREEELKQQQAAQKAETESNYVDLSLAESDGVRKDFETGDCSLQRLSQTQSQKQTGCECAILDRRELFRAEGIRPSDRRVRRGAETISAK
jgi:septal ring factor EnvC (AmiA/AmiB activator)